MTTPITTILCLGANTTKKSDRTVKRKMKTISVLMTLHLI